ncbi:MAG: nucleotidyltransferase domain-containing protein [Nitrospirae bacterium]|nr:nucleotidyltransferase domain-containing protein [Nitrospirota bacterium]
MKIRLEPPINKSLINTILKQLVSHLDVVKIIQFGSYVSGKPTKDSDLDLLVILNTKEKGIKRYAMVSELLEPRKIPMDIIVKTPDEIKTREGMFDPFMRNILKTGKVLYEKTT